MARMGNGAPRTLPRTESTGVRSLNLAQRGGSAVARLASRAFGWHPPFIMRANPESTPPEVERTEQAARLAAMLRRWATEDVSQEPNWDVEAVGRVQFRHSALPGHRVRHAAFTATAAIAAMVLFR